MAFPTSPTNGQIYQDTTTKRTWKYSSSIPAWRIEEFDVLSEYSNVDVTTTPPANGDELTLNSTATNFVPNGTIVPLSDPIETHAVPPLSTDQRDAGIVWYDSTEGVAYLAGSKTTPGSATTHTTGSTSTGPYTLNAGSGISQSLTITTAGTYNRLTVNTSSTGTYSFNFYLINGANADYAAGPVLASLTLTNVSVSPGALLISFPDTYLTAGQTVTWVLFSKTGNSSISMRIGSDAGTNVGAPVAGTNISHSTTLIALNQDWGFSFGYDIATTLTNWVKIGYGPPSGITNVWRSNVEPPIDPIQDGMMWQDWTIGRTFMYDADSTSWIQL
jgi:hypothetical protein